MNKKTIKIQCLVFLLLLIITIQANSQDHFTTELRWLFPDSLHKTILRDTIQIIESGLNNSGTFASYNTEKVKIEDTNIFILMVDMCSGIYCPFIEIFKEENNKWSLIMISHANLQSKIKIDVDTCKRKLIFKTGINQIGELSFGIFVSKSNK